MDLKEIRKLIRMLDGTLVSEVEIKRGEETLRITRAICAPPPAPAPVYQMPQFVPQGQPVGSGLVVMEKTEPEASVAIPNTVTITSPMVGTFYRSNDPAKPPLVQVGDVVKIQQPLAIIEAMKLMNEIESEYNGQIVAILKEDASLVEYGEALFIISPT